MIRYTDVMSRTAAYLAWPDARLRAFLREHDVDDSKLPGSRTSLLREPLHTSYVQPFKLTLNVRGNKDQIHSFPDHG